MSKILFIARQTLGATTHWWMPSIKKYLEEYDVVYTDYKNALNQYRAHKPKAVFLSYKGAQPPSNLIGVEFWQGVKADGVKVGAWNNHEWNRLQDNDFKNSFDKKVSADLNFIFDYSWTSTNVLPVINNNHFYIPYGYHDWHEQNHTGNYEMQVSFLGCNRGARVENDHRAAVLNQLSNKFEMHVAGRWDAGQLKDTVKFHGPIGLFGGSVKQVSDFYKNSRVVLDLPWQNLNLGHFRKSKNADKYGYLIDVPMHVTYRVLEAIGSGSLLVTLDCPMHRNLGLNEDNCIFYNTSLNEGAPSVIEEAVGRALACDQQKIRKNITALAAEHSYKQRWKQMFDLLLT